MTIANTTLSDTFALWLTRFNQVVQVVNNLTDGSTYSLGTLTLANPGYLNGNTTLNVSNGFIRVQGNTFSSNTLSLVSNSATLVISGSGRLGSNVYFDIASLSTSMNDKSTANIASANIVNIAYSSAVSANAYAESSRVLGAAAFDQANSGFVQANSAYNRANSAAAAAAPGFNQANTALAVAQAAFGAANTSNNNTVFTGNVSIAKANVVSQTLTDGATINWDGSLGQIASVTLAGNRTMAAPTNLKVGTYILHVWQDGTGGRTLTWNSAFKWTAAVAPVLSTGAGRHDIFSFVCDGANMYGSFLPDVR